MKHEKNKDVFERRYSEPRIKKKSLTKKLRKRQ